MKILILTDYYPPDKIGGVGEIAKHLRTEYEAKGHDVWVLTTGTLGGDPKVIRSSKSLIKGVFLNNIMAIKLIRRHQFDIINAHQSTTSLFLLTRYIPFLYKKFPKVVNSFQVSYFSEFKHIRSINVGGRRFSPTRKEYVEKWIYSPMHMLLDLLNFAFSEEITVVSTENKKEFDKTYGRLIKREIKIIPNGVDVDEFKPGPSRLKRELKDDLKGNTVFLYVGVFRVRKRVFNLLFALKRVVSKNNKVVLVLVGGGRDYEADILDLIDRLGLKDNVIFTGSVPNSEVVNYLNVADVFCTLSSYEGMPVAILEAMSAGKAILTSRVSGMVDLVEDGKDGYLTDVDNIDQIADRMLAMANGPKWTAKMGENARRKVVGGYTWSSVADRYIKLFKK